jgi:hypothetical protein
MSAPVEVPKVDMSPGATEQRLQEASRLSPLTFQPLLRVNMSPDSIEARLRECAEMSMMCWERRGGWSHGRLSDSSSL